MLSEVAQFYCAGVWIWRLILSIIPAVLRHCMKHVKRQLAVVTVDNDIAGVLCKMLHIFTDAEYADMPYINGFCEGSTTANVNGIFENVSY